MQEHDHVGRDPDVMRSGWPTKGKGELRNDDDNDYNDNDNDRDDDHVSRLLLPPQRLSQCLHR